jgi:hypothetical protein
MTLSIMAHNTDFFMLGITYAKGWKKQNAEFHYAEFCYAERHYAKCHYGESLC